MGVSLIGIGYGWVFVLNEYGFNVVVQDVIYDFYDGEFVDWIQCLVLGIFKFFVDVSVFYGVIIWEYYWNQVGI